MIFNHPLVFSSNLASLKPVYFILVKETFNFNLFVNLGLEFMIDLNPIIMKYSYFTRKLYWNPFFNAVFAVKRLLESCEQSTKYQFSIPVSFNFKMIISIELFSSVKFFCNVNIIKLWMWQ